MCQVRESRVSFFATLRNSMGPLCSGMSTKRGPLKHLSKPQKFAYMAVVRTLTKLKTVIPRF